MYSVVLFDLDHTLLDSDASQDLAYREVMDAFGIADPASHRATYDRINTELWAEVETGGIGPNDVRHMRFRRFIDERGIDADPVAMADRYVAALGQCGDLFDDAIDVLEHTAERARLGMVTNGIGEVQRSRIERLGIGNYFETIVISGEVGVAKPKNQIFDLAFDSMPGAERTGSLMVGDSLGSDIAGGINAGIDTCWYNRNAEASWPPPADRTPTHHITTLVELPPIVRGESR